MREEEKDIKVIKEESKEVKEETKIEKSPNVKKKYQVLSIRFGILYLMDEAKNGINMPLPIKHKNAQKGDTIYL